MSAPGEPTEADIHAYVDDALDTARRAEMDAILAADARLAARVSAYRADRDALRQALDGILTQALPLRWQDSIQASRRSRPALGRREAVAAGVAVMLVAAGGAALLQRADDGILQAALAARATGLGATLPAAPGDTTTRDARLASALGFKVRTPDLESFGFHLAALEVSGRRTAQFDYSDPAGRRLTIYVRASNGIVRFDLLRRGPVRVCVWQDDVVGAVIIAPMSAGEMMRVASSAYAALNL